MYDVRCMYYDTSLYCDDMELPHHVTRTKNCVQQVLIPEVDICQDLFSGETPRDLIDSIPASDFLT